MSSTKVIVLVGPKGSGKDVVGEHLLSRRSDVVVRRFKEELLQDTIDYYNISEDWFYSVYDNRETKEVPLVELDGKSPREAVIFVSEEVMKPQYGQQYYGERLLETLDPDAVNIITDGGVANITEDGEEDWVELQPIVEAVGKDNILIVQLYRNECSFEGDSRRYFGEPSLEAVVLGEYKEVIVHENDIPIFTPTTDNIPCIHVFNNSTLQELYDTFESLVGNHKRGTL